MKYRFLGSTIVGLAVFLAPMSMRAAPPLSPAVLPQAFVGSSYSVAIDADPMATPNTTPANNWTMTAVSGFSLPPGLSLSGETNLRVFLSGAPTLAGHYRMEISVRHPSGTPIYQSAIYDLYVSSESFNILPVSLPNGYQNVSYSVTFSTDADTAIGPFMWIYKSGAPIPGTTLNASTGVLSGVPTATGTFAFTVAATDANRTHHGSRTYGVSIVASTNPLTITSTLPFLDGYVGETYPAQFIQASGGVSPYTWSVSGGTVPPGLSFGADATLRGTPTAAGTYTFTTRVQDSIGNSASRSWTVTVRTRSTLSIVSSSVLSGTLNAPYASLFLAVGGRAPYRWSVSAGVLPPGLVLNADGSLRGTPAVVGTYGFTVRVTDDASVSADQSISFVVGPSSSGDGGLAERLDHLRQIGVNVHALVKLSDDGDPNTQYDTAVYYIATDGRRHAFPHEKVYFTWYRDFSNVVTISATNMASIPLGANVTYKPGVRLVKFQTDDHVYAVSVGRGTLRWIRTEDLAAALNGPFWRSNVEDISDAFYLDYHRSDDIIFVTDFSPSVTAESVTYVSEVLPPP